MGDMPTPAELSEEELAIRAQVLATVAPGQVRRPTLRRSTDSLNSSYSNGRRGAVCASGRPTPKSGSPVRQLFWFLGSAAVLRATRS